MSTENDFSGFRIPIHRGRGRSRSVSGQSNDGFDDDQQRSSSEDPRGRQRQSDEACVWTGDIQSNQSPQSPQSHQPDQSSSSTGQSERQKRRKQHGNDYLKKKRDLAAAQTMDPPEPSAHTEVHTEVNDRGLPSNPFDFATTAFNDPVKTLHESIRHLAAQKNIAFGEQVCEWAQQSDAMVALATSTGDNNAVIPGNSVALQELYKKYVPSFGVAKVYDIMSEEVDDGFIMPEEFGSQSVQSMQISTHLFIDGKIRGNPDQRALQVIALPEKSTEVSLLFRTTYVNPEHAYSYVYVKIYRWVADWYEKYLKQVGTIRIPLKLAQSKEPSIEFLDETATAKFMSVDVSQSTAVKYTLTCTAHCDLDQYAFEAAPQIMRDEIMMIRSMLNGQDQHEVTLIHKINTEWNDVENDFNVTWVRSSIDAWHRDGCDPHSIYFEKSPYKRIMTGGSVPKGDEIPYVPQLPPVSRFVDKSQYLVTFAVGKQQEKEYHERLHRQLEDTTIPIKARLIPDLPTRHPVSGKPKQYLMLVDPAFIPEIAHLLPRTSDHCRITFPGVKVQAQSNPGEVTKSQEELIADYIREVIQTEIDFGGHVDDETAFKALEIPLQCLCRKGSNADVENDSKRMKESIPELADFCDSMDNTDLINWVKREIGWLSLPPQELKVGDVDSIIQPLQCSAVRVAVRNKLWTPETQLYKLTVPDDPKTGDARLPYVLDIPDPTVDDQGKPITNMGSFIEKFAHKDSYVTIRFKFVDGNKTHEIEANALQKLAAPHTMPVHDRPSATSIDLFNDLITMKPRPIQPLRKRLPFLAQLDAGTHESKHLQEMYNQLSTDKHDAVKVLLDDTRALHIINGPPGTGKTELLMSIAGFAIATVLPADHIAELDRLGPKISLEKLDQSDVAEIARPSSTITAKNKGNADTAAPARSRSTHYQVLYVTNNNATTDDVVFRAKKTFALLNVSSFLHREPVIIRTYCLKNEFKGFPSKFTRISREIQRQGIDGLGGVVWSLISGISESVHTQSQKDRKMKGTSVSLADVAATLFEKDKIGARKYKKLDQAIRAVKDGTYPWDEMARLIFRETEIGPFADAIGMADFIATTHVPAADIRPYFRPDIVIEDEQPRVMESASLILIAHYSPLALFGVGDTRQCGPLVFSGQQRKRYEEHGQDLPRPATFSQQLKWSLQHRWVASGNPVISLKQNFRASGKMSSFFNIHYYNGRLSFKFRRLGTYAESYKTTLKFLKKLTQNDKTVINSVMVNLNSREGVSGGSATNMTNVNFVMAKVHELLSDSEFTGKIMIIAPYRGQLEIYDWELSQLCAIEHDSRNKSSTFDRTRVSLRTHQGAQGAEAEVVFVDMVRSKMPGMTSEPELINVVSSRAIHAQVIVQNTAMLDKLERRGLSNEPHVRDLYRLYRWHTEAKAYIELPGIDYRDLCKLCYKTGHKKKDCPLNAKGSFIMPRHVAETKTIVPKGPSENMKRLAASHRLLRDKNRELREKQRVGT